MTKPSRPWVRVALVVALAGTIYAARVRSGMVDFGVYYTAASRASAAEPLYRPDDEHYQFKYLPAFAVAMAPAAWLPLEVAKPLWFAASAALLWALVAWSIDALPGRRRSVRALAWLTLLLMGKFYARELNLGQTNVLLGAILVAALRAAQQQRAWRAGALVGLGVFVKPYAAILLPWLVPAAGLAGGLAAGVVMALGLMLPAAIYGWHGNIEQVLGWYHTVTDTTAPNLFQPENVSVAAMWAKWLGAGPLAGSLAAATILVALGVVAWVMAQRARVARPAYLEFGMLMLLVPLVSPQGWDYVLLLATPAVILLVDRFALMSAVWRAAAALALGVTSFTLYDLLGRELYTRLMAMSVMSVSALALVVCLAHLRRRALA